MTSAVYVGTYSKYNAGSIKGEWINLEQIGDYDDFLTACRDIHSDEVDPELMFQDFEGFPKRFYGESHIDEAVFDWLQLSESEKELLEAYFEATGDHNATIEDAEDRFYGHFESFTDLAMEYAASTGLFEGANETLERYFDYEAFGRDLSLDFVEHNGFYFFNH